MSRAFGDRLSLRPGDRPCLHCGKGLSDHLLAMRRCYFPKTSTRYAPAEALNADLGDLDADDLSALEQLFATLLRGGDTRQLMQRATMASAMLKVSRMHERAKAQKSEGP